MNDGAERTKDGLLRMNGAFHGFPGRRSSAEAPKLATTMVVAWVRWTMGRAEGCVIGLFSL